LSGIFHQLAAQSTGATCRAPNATIEKQANFSIGTTPALILARARWSGPTDNQGVLKMFTLASARETATVIAGAFISALLLVSAATSLPIA
jgi:hypothetical protein